MTDNLLELLSLQPDIIVAELIDKTKRCAITWDQISYTTYSSAFLWKNDWYDVYTTQTQYGYVLDVVRNKRKVFNLNSYTNDQVQSLYYVITDTMKYQTIKEIIQDLNTLAPCTIVPRQSANDEDGGVLVGGSGVVSVVNAAQPILYMAAPDVAGGSLQAMLDSFQINTILTGRYNIDDVAADTAYGKIFWTQNEQNGGRPSGCVLYSCNLNGTGVATVLSLPTYDKVNAIALDVFNHHIYYIQQRLSGSNSNTVYDVRRCDYDGSNIVSVADGNTYICSPTSICIDTTHEYVYWCDNFGLTEGYVHRANFDGSGGMTLMSTTGYVRALFVWGDYLYLVGVGLFTRTNLGGGGQESLPTAGLSILDSIAVYGSTIYMSDIGINYIVSTDSEGANLQYLSGDLLRRTGLGSA